MRYQVAQYRNGIFDSIVSGLGKNRGTWDSDHSRSAAYKHAKELREEVWRNRAGLSYRVLKTNIEELRESRDDLAEKTAAYERG